MTQDVRRMIQAESEPSRGSLLPPNKTLLPIDYEEAAKLK